MRYMSFRKGNAGSQSRIGGQPSLLPNSFPWPSKDDPCIGFTLQLTCDPIWLPIPECAYLQLWQPLDPGDDPKPLTGRLTGRFLVLTTPGPVRTDGASHR